MVFPPFQLLSIIIVADLIQCKNANEMWHDFERCVDEKDKHILQRAKNIPYHQEIFYFLVKGIFVLPIYSKTEIVTVEHTTIEIMRTLPECKRGVLNDNRNANLGSFGAFATPSSQHHTFIRQIRDRIYKKTREVLFENMIDFMVLFATKDEERVLRSMKVSALIDRLCRRFKGTCINAESAHRDVTPGLGRYDAVLGGWLNMNAVGNQRFSCKPGSHLDADETFGSGFVRTSEGTSMQTILIPEGHFVVFFQNILHEVNKVKYTRNMIRMFMGFYLSPKEEPLFGHAYLSWMLGSLGVAKVPSGDNPPIMSRNHGSCFKNKPFTIPGFKVKMSAIEWFYHLFHPIVQEHWPAGEPNKQDRSFGTLTLEKLAKLGLPLSSESYQPYSEEEKGILLPSPLSGQRKRKPCSGRESAPRLSKRSRPSFDDTPVAVSSFRI